MFDPLPTDISFHDYYSEQQPPYTAALLKAPPHPSTMSSPPLTPIHRRQSSNFSTSSRRHSQSHSRRSSAAYSPAHSRLGSSHGPGGGDSLAQEFADLGDGGGLGSLADELGGWSGDEMMEEEGIEEVDEDMEGEFGASVVANGHGHGLGIANGTLGGERERDSGIDVGSSPPNGKILSPGQALGKKGHRRINSAYDGSEYGSDSDLEETELVSASLEARMASVEALARRGLEETGTEGDRVVQRAIEKLRDLGWQSGIETGTTRLSTAYNAISTNLSKESRIMTQLTQHIFSPFATSSLDPDFIEDLIPHIDATVSILPTILPSSQPLNTLHSLLTQTTDLVQALDYLKDSLHMNQQTTKAAARMLKAAKEATGAWRKEMDSRDESVRWVEQGCWDQRLRTRECAGVCEDVMSGFEDTCEMWRERLKEGLEVGAT